MNPNDQNINGSLLPNPEISTPVQGCRYAGFWMRMWAYSLDLIVIQSMKWLIIHPVFRMLKLDLGDSGIFSPISVTSAIVFYGYFVLMTKCFGQTLGKMVFGLKVVTLPPSGKLSWGTVLFREWIGRYICGVVAVLYLIVAFTPKKQGLHDIFADTAVIHERQQEPLYTYAEPAS
ncbi:putative membrane protein YteJ [Weizmannia acidilactici]|uniref:Membrane protein YteJ n=1 Tax=Weizmannia acidilactici TaxID=2607726 RepID=A0A5J4JRL9_9BACI|nr:RDD family protein [Weizmannia acidilactici]GER66989.1 putative membrane protein YteJ [Weizmannia acidilactici]GER71754.1 putative membrane protein YteJ [Weizmannia acidilactici]GER75109.1 putative membrane protein YteJ [Weizmannia acidilactici]